MSRPRTEPASVWRRHNALKQLIGQIGTVKAFTRVYQGPAELIQRTPYYVAIVYIAKLKKNLTVQIVREHDAAIAIGKKVQLIPRKHQVSPTGLILYAMKAIVL